MENKTQSPKETQETQSAADAVETLLKEWDRMNDGEDNSAEMATEEARAALTDEPAYPHRALLETALEALERGWRLQHSDWIRGADKPMQALKDAVKGTPWILETAGRCECFDDRCGDCNPRADRWRGSDEDNRE